MPLATMDDGPLTTDQRFMRRALRLATLSLGMTWPNPGVGCVLVRDGVEIGAGRHRVCGERHAETAAIADCRARGHDPAGATAYVTLAPCTRHGRQPPCVDALRAARVARVVAAIADPVQDDAGAALAAAGIAYAVGVEADRARHLHGGFLARLASGMPRITGKWAMTLDGSIATAGGDSRWISSPAALALSRRRRRAFDAIVVGMGTARRDDPTLAATRPRLHGVVNGPLRVVVGARGDLDPGAKLVASAREQPVLVVCAEPPSAAISRRLGAAGVELAPLADPHDALAVARELGRRGLNEVLIEGGAHLHAAFLGAGLYTRLEIYLGATTLGGGLPVAAGLGAALIADGQRWEPEEPPRLLGSTTLLRLRRLS